MRALLALLIACSAPARPPVLDNTAAPAAPPPEVTRTDGIATRGLPAAAADGSRIVIAAREPDGARGMPNLALVVKARDDFQLERHVVLSVAEADQFLDDAEGNNPALDARVARANEWLRARHATLRLEPLVVLEPEAPQIGGVRARATHGTLTAVWSKSQLRITDGATTLVDIGTPSSWLPEPQLGTTPCVRTPHLGGAAIDRAKKLAVITISYTADTDFCFEPPDQHHVITW